MLRKAGDKNVVGSLSYSSPASAALQERYRRLELLGQGGMCEVHRAFDEVGGREVALKQLLPSRWTEHLGRDAMALLEAEYHTLAQLEHPSIIEVYDYGIDERGPYYTMELLSGSDLQALAPLPWRDACRLLLDVTSSLAVMHSRGLLHRDVSARNVRRTADGRAKLLDFGAMTEMGLPSNLVGTPMYMPPEAARRQPLDGRSDLYSLGAMAYLLLTGRLPYRATRLDQLKDLWRSPPPPPRALIGEIPKTLSDLVMSLLKLDVLSRPQNAAEVMMRLSSIADLPVVEDSAVQHAYLTVPRLTARDETVLRVRKQLIRALRGRGGVLRIDAEPGLGRSRLLDACVLEGQLAGALVARADRRDGARSFGAARRIVLGLLEDKPSLAELVDRFELSPLLAAVSSQQAVSGADTERSVALGRFTSFFLEVTRRQPLLIAIDDLHLVDEPSVAVLAGIAREAAARRLVVVFSADVSEHDSPGLALRLLSESARALPLRALDAEQTRALLATVFGDVPNIELLSSVAHELCRGNPRDIMNAAQRLVDMGVARYEGGRWFLADEAAKITACVGRAEHVSDRIATLSEGARRLLALLALDRDDKLEASDYGAAFPADHTATVHEALSELVRARWLVRTEQGHRFNRLNDRRGIVAGLDEPERRGLHTILANCVKTKPLAPIYEAYHLVQAGKAAEAHDAMRRQMAIEAARPTRVRDAIELDTAERMVEAGVREGWPLSILTQYRTFSCWLAAVSGAYERVQPLVAATLDALAGYGGLKDYEASSDLPNEQRLKQALDSAQARYAATPAEHQPFTPVAALGALTRVGALAATCGYLMAEPDLFAAIPSLAPLAPLSPAFGFADRLIGAFKSLALGQLWIGWDELRNINDDVATLSDRQLEPHNRYALELASLSGLCSFDAKYATSTAPARCDALARMQPDQAENYRMLHHLAQGRLTDAERSRKQCEILSLRAGATDDTRITRLLTEMVLFPLADDLMGLKRAGEGLDHVVQKRPGWRYRRDYTRARELRLRGRLADALSVIEGSLKTLPERHFDWCPTVEEHVLLLTELGRASEAIEKGNAYALRARELKVPTAWLELAIALGMAESGMHAEARQKWQSAHDALKARDIGGIHLGYAHEVAARIARRRGDGAQFEVHASACSEVYTTGGYPALHAKYLRLMESGQTGASAPPGALEADAELEFDLIAIRAAFEGTTDVRELAERALSLLFAHTGARRGVLLGMRGGRLRAAAGAEQLEKGTIELAEQYLSAEIEASSEATRTQMDDVGTLAGTESTLSVVKRYEPVVLRTTTDQEERIVGIALLLNDEQHVRTAMPSFVAVLGEHLQRYGVFDAVTAAG